MGHCSSLKNSECQSVRKFWHFFIRFIQETPAFRSKKGNGETPPQMSCLFFTIFFIPPYDIMRTSSDHHTKILRTFREHLENIWEHLWTSVNWISESVWEHLWTSESIWTHIEHIRERLFNICEHLRASWEKSENIYRSSENIWVRAHHM